jgi:hypothetical protein
MRSTRLAGEHLIPYFAEREKAKAS